MNTLLELCVNYQMSQGNIILMCLVSPILHTLTFATSILITYMMPYNGGIKFNLAVNVIIWYIIEYYIFVKKYVFATNFIKQMKIKNKVVR